MVDGHGSSVIAVVGAESTGKTTLALGIAQALCTEGRKAVVVPEYLREFCEVRRRTPRPDEQAAIAAEQTRRIAEAARSHDVVVADTTALMTAVYSDFLFNDRALYGPALADQASVRLTLLTALDLAWEADGMRDGAHVREPVDTLIRHHLMDAGLPFSVVAGSGRHRLDQAMLAIRPALATDEERARSRAESPRWRWICERCDDGDCERHPWRLPRA